jgi:hypothetical protein
MFYVVKPIGSHPKWMLLVGTLNRTLDNRYTPGVEQAAKFEPERPRVGDVFGHIKGREQITLR